MTYSNFKLNAMTNEPCNCGQTDVVYSELENQCEPLCWECFYNYEPLSPEWTTSRDDWFPKDYELPF